MSTMNDIDSPKTHPLIDSIKGDDWLWRWEQKCRDDHPPSCDYCHRKAARARRPHWYREVCRWHQIQVEIGSLIFLLTTPVWLIAYAISNARSDSNR